MKTRDGIPENIKNKMYEDSAGEDAMIYIDHGGTVYVHSDDDKEYTVIPEKKRGRRPKKAAKATG